VSGKEPSWKEVEIKTSFTRWFTSDGYFVAKPFQQWLATELPLLGEADPSNVVEEIGRGSASKDAVRSVQPTNVEEVISASRNATPGEAKKRRKR
jgi:hypothetical protein